MATERFLLDTSAWILALRKNPLESFKERLENLLKENAVTVTPIVKVELLGGTKSKKEFERLKMRLDSLEQLVMNEDVWDRASRLAYELRRKGITVPYTDTMIAATAIHYETPLIHSDKHFDIIASKSPLRVESVE